MASEDAVHFPTPTIPDTATILSTRGSNSKIVATTATQAPVSSSNTEKATSPTAKGGPVNSHASTTLTEVPSNTKIPPPKSSATAPAIQPTASSQSNKAALIGGIVGGLIAIVLFAFLVWFYLVRRGKNKEIVVRNIGSGDLHRLGKYGDSYYTGRTSLEKTIDSKLGLSPSATGLETIQENEVPFSPSSYQYPTITEVSKSTSPISAMTPDSEQPGISPTSAGIVSQLSSDSAPIAELSPNPEQSEINDPWRTSRSRYPRVISNNDSHLSRTHSERDADTMQPNLNAPQDKDNSKRKHVLSWMDYENEDSGRKT
ncbi:MAG: hypothetical protein LQ351_007172 [Letrouitia transgressa]|nr:MAG: hypothetical protein LQ351_007172 [Letrouitia transgressa]